MKYVLEFGRKGGPHIDNAVIPSLKLGMQLASALVCTFENDSCACTPQQWVGRRSRSTWESESHFVALSKLDGKLRGAASAGLWRKGSNSLFPKIVNHSD